MPDQIISCRGCEQPFTFTADEQSFYADHGYATPQWCTECRAKRRAQKAAQAAQAAEASGRFGRGGGYGGMRQLYPAVCSACGQPTEVPFEPRSDKPVFCRPCFADRRNAAPAAPAPAPASA